VGQGCDHGHRRSLTIPAGVEHRSLILAGSLLGFTDDKSKVFDIAIQSGAIFAVVLVYWQRLRDTFVGARQRRGRTALRAQRRDRLRPGGDLGLLFGKMIKAHLFTPVVVATTFILGGFVILWAERRQSTARIETVDDMRPLDALKVGLVQCLPWCRARAAPARRSSAACCSASAARRRPTSASSSRSRRDRCRLYSLWKERALLSTADIPLFAVGLVFSFVAAWLCVRWLLRYISTHTFTPFAWYRIAFGIVVLVTAYGGLVTWAD
jgi:undecaprenyl-diphosphatase